MHRAILLTFALFGLATIAVAGLDTLSFVNKTMGELNYPDWVRANHLELLRILPDIAALWFGTMLCAVCVGLDGVIRDAARKERVDRH